MEDDFEYHVAFSPAKSEDEEKDKLTFRLTSPNGDPVIVLFGWFDCKSRYLAKYSEFYEKHGCTVVRYIAPPSYIMSSDPQQKLIPHAQKLVTVLHDYSLTEQPFIFHIFSNGGAMMYDVISKELLKEENSKIKIHGCIFDSCPGKTSIFTLANVMSTRQKGGPVRRFLLGWLTAILLTLYFYWNYMFGTQTDSSRGKLWFRLLEEPRSHPQLFLCSQADRTINHSDILDFMTLREQKGINVSSVVWQDSEHVAHFRDHPESYVTHCLEFVRHCLDLEDEDD